MQYPTEQLLLGAKLIAFGIFNYICCFAVMAHFILYQDALSFPFHAQVVYSLHSRVISAPTYGPFL